jgi:hypothetical protein
MTLRRVGNILTVAGLVVTVAAFAWWLLFYSTIMRELSRATNAPPGGNSVFDAISCLYSSKDVCGLFAGAARFAGKTPYEPMLLWVGLAGLVLGVVVRLISKPAGRA